MLHTDDRVVAANSGLEQTVVVRRGRGADDDQARNVDVPCLKRLRMLRSGRAPHAGGLADDQGHAALTSEHEAVFRSLVDQLIDTDDLWFTQEGDDLLVQILDNQRGSLRIQDWYAAGSSGDAAKLDAFETSAGQVLVEANLQQLVDAMAGLPANGSDVVDSYKDQVPASVQTAISQAWSSS